MRLWINRPGMSPAWQHLSGKYVRLLALHDKYRRSPMTARFLPSIGVALDHVRARLDALENERRAA